MPIFQIKESPLALIGKLVVFVALGIGSVVGAALIALILYVTMFPFAPFSSRTRPLIEYVAQIQNQVPQESPPPTPTPIAESLEKSVKAEGEPPLEYVVVVQTEYGDIPILLGQESVIFQFHGESPTRYYKPIVITKEDYPKLFEQGAAWFSYISVEKFEDALSESLFMILKNNLPDHGGFTPVYAIIVYLGPFESEVVYEVPAYFMPTGFNSIEPTEYAGVLKIQGLKGFYSGCTECRLKVMEFISYDVRFDGSNGKGMFFPVNRKFKREFAELLKEYNRIEKEGCLYQGETREFLEIRALGGDEARCEHWFYPGEEKEYFISMGEYFAMKRRIMDIIEGKAESMAP